MGEQSSPPNQNGHRKTSDDPTQPNNENGGNENEINTEEYRFLDSQLDALNMALDDIEQKNDNIHAQLLLLLQSNREIRTQMQEAMEVSSALGGK